jgi:ADP-heptose:LPS heptosyltransferase
MRGTLTQRFLWWAFVLRHVDALAARGPVRTVPGRVLIVRLDRIGDFVLWLDSAKAIRELYPPKQYHITLLGSDGFTDLAREIAYFDDVWEVNRDRFVTNLSYRYKMMRRVAAGGFSLVLHPTWGRDFLWGDATVRASRAPERIGFNDASPLMSGIARAISNRWYTRLIEGSARPLMMLARNAEFVRALGCSSFMAKLPVLEVPNGVRAQMADGPYYCVCPGASRAIKQWPIERFAAVAQRLFEHTGWKGLVCGAQQEKQLGQALKRLCTAPLEDYTGRTTLPELADILRGARLVIANDSAAVHLAAATGVKSVCILGGAHYGTFAPYDTGGCLPPFAPRCAIHPMDCYGCNWECVHNPGPDEPAPCISGISVDDAWAAVLACLDEEAVLASGSNHPALR